jgi:hypothetical protein
VAAGTSSPVRPIREIGWADGEAFGAFRFWASFGRTAREWLSRGHGGQNVLLVGLLGFYMLEAEQWRLDLLRSTALEL